MAKQKKKSLPVNLIWHLVLVIFLPIILLFSCGKVNETNSIDSNVILATAYPRTNESNGYPSEDTYTPPTLPSNEAYPAPTQSTGVLLSLNKPVRANDTIISGVGPAGLEIVIQNITMMGEVVGYGTIQGDGTFSVQVPSLDSNVRIGLAADIELQGLTLQEIQPGNDAISVPMVGYFYDSTVVRIE